MHRINPDNKAFTLMEAMMALVILTIASAGLLLPFASSAAVQEEGTRRTLAAKLGCGLMEKIISTDYDSIIATYGDMIRVPGKAGSLETKQSAANIKIVLSSEDALVLAKENPGKEVVFVALLPTKKSVRARKRGRETRRHRQLSGGGRRCAGHTDGACAQKI